MARFIASPMIGVLPGIAGIATVEGVVTGAVVSAAESVNGLSALAGAGGLGAGEPPGTVGDRPGFVPAVVSAFVACVCAEAAEIALSDGVAPATVRVKPSAMPSATPVRATGNRSAFTAVVRFIFNSGKVPLN
ncbi:hypothetical protein GCM10027038_26850 [Arthrobacter bambusae]